MTKARYAVVFKRSALKELETLPDRIQQKILDSVQLLAINPRTELLHSKKLKGADTLFRIRVGDYRVIYTIEDNVIRITVIKIGHRREIYR